MLCPTAVMVTVMFRCPSRDSPVAAQAAASQPSAMEPSAKKSATPQASPLDVMPECTVLLWTLPLVLWVVVKVKFDL